MIRRVAGAILLSWLLATPLAAGGTLAFGARTQIWPFLYAPGAAGERALTPDEQVKRDVTEGNLERYGALGASWNIVEAWQDFDGPDGYARLDRVFSEHERRGVQVALRVLERPEIYDAIRAGDEAAATAIGEYRAWVGQLAARYGTRARYYMVSNEADHDVGFNRTVYRAFRPVAFDEYARLLREAHAAIEAVDPRLVVADHGVSAWSLALAVMSDRVLAGEPGQALAFWRAMAYESPGEGERSLPRMLAMLAGGDARHRVEFARRSVGELAPWRDVFQLHHYHGPAILPELLGWIRGRLGPAAAQRVVAAEVGYMIPTKPGAAWDGRPMNVADMARYSPEDHGAFIARSLAALGGSGVEDVLWWQLRFHVARDPVASLYPASSERDDFREGYPAQAFRHSVRELAGAAPVATTPAADGLAEYRFRRDGEFSVIWSTTAVPVALPPAARARVARIADAAGTPVDPAHWDGRVGPAPLWVYWQS